VNLCCDPVVVAGVKDSKGKAKELSQWESDLRRREAVSVPCCFLGFYITRVLTIRSIHSFVIFLGEGHQEEGGSSQEWYACTISLA
jgi:hypothetical protein